MSKHCAPLILLFGVFFLAVFVLLAPQSFAQSQQPAAASPTVPRMYDATKEVVLNGTISEVVSRPKTGLPLGLYLMLTTTQGEVALHLGPYYGRIAAEKGLVPGATIQVTGVTSTFTAGEIFLARTVAVGGQTLTIRSQNGFPVRPTPNGTRAARGAQPAGGQ
ncbi:MAG TPA: hypothetical protein VEG63_07740 [Candidatus Acidoferrales bacterium]|nr:hypothetical protein [Candidatus Acidoferrales bacterium]